MWFAILSAALAGPPAEPDWAETLDAVVPAVVSLRVAATRSFDTDSAGSSVATGFVVDRERGILLTNRHVANTGPVVAEALFQNNEEVDVVPIYRDPIHDFAFMRFDPAAVQFMTVPELRLAPGEAKVGEEVRIVGNDAGEKISILSGTLARLDRDAPHYGGDTFNDFNTFYYQAASGTSGGSSGSPVVRQDGAVVALNAGSSNRAASSFFLPLERVDRALKAIQAGESVTRGTLQTVFRHKTFDELGRLGLRPDTVAQVREQAPQGTGLLVVAEVVPGGPGDGKLAPGDVLHTLNGSLLQGFSQLEAVLDAEVGGQVQLGIERGGQPLDLALKVGDLHALMPRGYVELGDALVHELSYQQARNHTVPVAGVYVASTGFSFSAGGIQKGSVITQLGDQPIDTPQDLLDAWTALPHGARVPVRSFSLRNPRRSRVHVVIVDRRWFPVRSCQRDDDTGAWPCQDAQVPAPDAAEAPPATAVFSGAKDRRERVLQPSLVMVENRIPYRVEGVHGARFQGVGVVVDADRGLVVVDRDTVPIHLGEVFITFGGSVRVPATVHWVHPAHNLSLVQYDPASIGETPVRAARLNAQPLVPGDPVWQVGLSSDQRSVVRATEVARVDPLSMPLPRPPFFRDTHLDVVDPEAATLSAGGVLADRRGDVRALWSSFVDLSDNSPKARLRGMPAGVLLEVMDALERGQLGQWPVLDFELGVDSLANARDLGLDEPTALALDAHDPERRQVLIVRRLTADTAAAHTLEVGDLVVGLDGVPVTRFWEVEKARWSGPLALDIVRNGKPLRVSVPSSIQDGGGVDRVLGWAGALLHETPHWLPQQRALPRTGVYVAWYWYGSPADRYGLRPTRRITQVNGVATPNLDAFIAAVSGLQDRDGVRLTVLSLDNKERVVTLKLDTQFWDPFALGQDERGQWRRTALHP